jgi:hypothetical protein
MALTKDQVAAIHNDLRTVMQAVCEKHNLTMANTHITYSDVGFKLTGEFGSKDELGDINPILHKDMSRHGWKFGLSVDSIGREFVSGVRTFKIEGMRGYTFVIAKLVKSAVRGDKVGGSFKFRGEEVQKLLNHAINFDAPSRV